MMAKEKLSLNDIKIAETLCNQAVISNEQLNNIKQKFDNQLTNVNGEEPATLE
jgi:adenine-specific DNA methylase